MKKSFLCLITFYAFAACTLEEKKIPTDILPIDKMKFIVWDMVQAGVYADNFRERDTALKKLNTAYFTEVLKIHNITKSDFFKSFDYYQSHPYLNQVLFDSLSAYAQRERGELFKKMQ